MESKVHSSPATQLNSRRDPASYQIAGRGKFKVLTRWGLWGAGCLVFGILSGCASMKEAARGVAGVSTKVLEEGRKNAIMETVHLDYATCFAKTLEALKKQGAYVYYQDMKKHMMAFYVSDEDTTPVGVFFKEIDAQNTQWEVSSPSNHAKELFAKHLSSAFNPKEEKGKDVYEGK
ncbi:MAG: hypothetical protein V1923_06170 [Candidatus Omnitrophota bacterium]